MTEQRLDQSGEVIGAQANGPGNFPPLVFPDAMPYECAKDYIGRVLTDIVGQYESNMAGAVVSVQRAEMEAQANYNTGLQHGVNNERTAWLRRVMVMCSEIDHETATGIAEDVFPREIPEAQIDEDALDQAIDRAIERNTDDHTLNRAIERIEEMANDLSYAHDELLESLPDFGDLRAEIRREVCNSPVIRHD